MPAIRIYHNPEFLAYRGNHDHIILPDNPIATIKLPDMPTPQHALQMTYHLSQHLYMLFGINLIYLHS